jgi:class 3 adenylate cyclase
MATVASGVITNDTTAAGQLGPGSAPGCVSPDVPLLTGPRQAPSDGLSLRIGLHAGEPIEEHGDLFGNAVNLAARLCAFAGPSEILVSETIRDMSVELGVPFEDLGTVKLKGFEKKCVRVFSIRWAQRGSSGSADSA